MSEKESPKTQIAKKIYDHYPSLQNWDGEPYGYDEPSAQHAKARAEAAAEAILTEVEGLLAEARAESWELAVESIRYPDGTKVPVQENTNPFKNGGRQ